MRRIAAVVPTRGRPATAKRAIGSFVGALRAAGHHDPVRIVVAVDSDGGGEVAELVGFGLTLRSELLGGSIEILRPPERRLRERDDGLSSPGRARNRGMNHIRAGPIDHEVTVLFDDDVSFGNTVYQGLEFRCDGAALIDEALRRCSPSVVVGCPYVGRQDLSVIEHLRLDRMPQLSTIAPATIREDVPNVAPGEISTGFLMIGSPVHELPAFPEHYNEDYVWLHALRRAGWSLERTSQALVHAPPGRVSADENALAFQVFGEIVWLGVLEEASYPLDRGEGLPAAILEICGDLAEALRTDAVRRRPSTTSVIRAVLDRYENAAEAEREGTTTPLVVALRTAVRAGLDLKPGV